MFLEFDLICMHPPCLLDLDIQQAMIGKKNQKNIPNAISRTIRKDGFRQINEKISPHAKNPDSLTGTGITESERNP